MHKTKGKLSCHPRSKNPLEPFWLVIDADKDLGNFYLEMTKLAFKDQPCVINESRWGPHVSIIRGEFLMKPSLFEKLDGVEIEFEYDTEVKMAGRHFYLDVVCKKASELRILLNLPPEPEIPFHLTIGIMEEGY